MNAYLMGILVLLASSGATALADAAFECRSKGKEIIYFSEGTVNLRATIKDVATLEEIRLKFENTNHGSFDRDVRGKVSGNWIRFTLFGDHLCNYRVAFPRKFEGHDAFPAFLDAFCEENIGTSIKLNCHKVE